MKCTRLKLTIIGWGLLLAALAGALGGPAGADPAPSPGALSAGPGTDYGAPAELRDKVVLVWRLLREGKFEQARAICQHAYDAATDDVIRAVALRGIGETYKEEFLMERAADYFHQVLARFPGSPQAPWALIGLGEAYTWLAKTGAPREHNIGLATPLLERFLRDYPGPERAGLAALLLGWCYEQHGSDEAALAQYEKAASPYAGYHWADQCLQRTLALQIEMERWEGVLASAKRYLELFPGGGQIVARMALAAAYGGRGEWASALQQFDHILARYPDSMEQCAEGWAKLVDVMRDRDQVAAAGSFCRELLQRYPQGERAAFAKFGLGYAAVTAGDMPYGQWWYRQVLAEHPASGVAAEARYRLGWSLTWDHPTEAIVHLKQVVATDSNERRLADGLLALGIAYGALREYEAARAAYAELLARGGDDYRYRHPPAHHGLGVIYYERQQYDLARAHLETVIARWPTADVAERARRTLANVVRDQAAAAAEGGAE